VSDESTRPWGRYEIIDDSPTHKVKKIWVSPGQRLSYQKHEKRAEHWFIVYGQGEVTLDGVVRLVSAGDSVDVPIRALHRISNVGSQELLFVEVQTGSYFGEDDIVRVEDDFGRV
jgi:mannose-6-phosphate isomerase